MALNEGGDGVEDGRMGDILHIDFARRVKISAREWLAGATRCEREADRQPEGIAATLRRCAASYRVRAAEGGGA